MIVFYNRIEKFKSEEIKVCEFHEENCSCLYQLDQPDCEGLYSSKTPLLVRGYGGFLLVFNPESFAKSTLYIVEMGKNRVDLSYFKEKLNSFWSSEVEQRFEDECKKYVDKFSEKIDFCKVSDEDFCRNR